MTVQRDEPPSAPGPALDEDAFLARVAALGIALPPDRRAAVLEGARHLHAAARLLGDTRPAPETAGAP